MTKANVGASSVQNTRISLLYRDASNYKYTVEVVLAGLLTVEQLATLRSAASDGCFIIAHQVGLPTPSFQAKGKDDWPSDELDHVWTTLAVDDGSMSLSDWHTADPCTLPMPVSEFVAEVAAMKGNWDVAGEWERMQNAA